MNDYGIVDYVNQMPGLICIKDKSSIIHACSPLLTKMIGFNSPMQVQGLTDFDMRCDAVSGAEQFILQDHDAFKRGENIAINVYTYADGNKTVMYGQKTPLIIAGEVIGLNVMAQDLTHLGKVANQFHSLLATDGNFLSVDQQKAATYTLYDTYPDLDLTHKESLCLFFILRGKSNKEIAQALTLSVRTIEGKVVAIKDKMQCFSRNQIVEKALSKGYLEIIIKEIFTYQNLSLTLN